MPQPQAEKTNWHDSPAYSRRLAELPLALLVPQ